MRNGSLSTLAAVEAPAAPVAAPSQPVASDAANAIIQGLLEDAKAEDIVTIDLRGRTALADTMIVASGRSNRHVGAITDRLVRGLKDQGFGRVNVEGLPQADWVLVDAGDVIVHVFRPEVRTFYNIEKMWSPERPVERLRV